MFVSPAWAQAAGGGGDGGFMTLLPLILIFVVFYFLLIRPQQKKAKQHRDMLLNIRRGDKIVTGGGIIGTVTRVVSDDELAVEIAEGIKIRVQRGLVSGVLSRTEPVGNTPASGGTADAPAGEKQGGGSLMSKLFGGK
jgi:preprotein translocase subunit YajC